MNVLLATNAKQLNRRRTRFMLGFLRTTLLHQIHIRGFLFENAARPRLLWQASSNLHPVWRHRKLGRWLCTEIAV